MRGEVRLMNSLFPSLPESVMIIGLPGRVAEAVVLGGAPISIFGSPPIVCSSATVRRCRPAAFWLRSRLGALASVLVTVTRPARPMILHQAIICGCHPFEGIRVTTCSVWVHSTSEGTIRTPNVIEPCIRSEPECFKAIAGAIVCSLCQWSRLVLWNADRGGGVILRLRFYAAVSPSNKGDEASTECSHTCLKIHRGKWPGRAY